MATQVKFAVIGDAFVDISVGPLDALPSSVARAVGLPIPSSSADPSGAPVSARDAPSIPGSPRLVTHRLVLGVARVARLERG